MLLLARFQVNARKAAQSLQRSPRHLREADVKLHHFVAIPLARVLHIHFNVQRIAGLQCGIRKLQIPLYSKVE